MTTTRQNKSAKPPLQMSDLICRRCRVQPTCDDEHICGICKAIGKSMEPETQNDFWQKILFSTEFTRELFFWLKGWNHG